MATIRSSSTIRDGKNGAIDSPIDLQIPIKGYPKVKRSIKAATDLEYVAGGGWVWTQSFLRTLPFYVDDITRDFGEDIYERMLHDPKVYQCVETVKLSALSEGWHVRPARQKDDPDYDKAAKIADFVERALDQMEIPLSEVLYEMLDGIVLGNKVAEKVYRLGTRGILKGKVVPRYLKTKPRRAIAFIVDVYNNIQAIQGLLPIIEAPLVADQLLMPDFDAPNVLPRDKFMVFTYRPQNGDPRGRSILRSAYTHWWLKQQGYPGYLKFMAQWASASLVGTLAENAFPEPEVDPATGLPVVDEETGGPRMIQPRDQMAQALADFQAGSYMVVPFGAEVVPIEVRGEGAPFDAYNAWCDNQIELAITLQKLATSEGESMSRAAAGVHQDTMGLMVQWAKECMENCLRRDLVTDLVTMNFGERALDLIPIVSLSETAQQDFQGDAAAISELFQDGYLDVEQLPELDARLGLPNRSDESLERRKAEVDAKHQQSLAEAETAVMTAQMAGMDPSMMGGDPSQMGAGGAQMPAGMPKSKSVMGGGPAAADPAAGLLMHQAGLGPDPEQQMADADEQEMPDPETQEAMAKDMLMRDYS